MAKKGIEATAQQRLKDQIKRGIITFRCGHVDCKYADYTGGMLICDFISATGKSRGEPAMPECKYYEPFKKKRGKNDKTATKKIAKPVKGN